MKNRKVQRKTKIWALLFGVSGLLFATFILILFIEQDGMKSKEISFTDGSNILKGVLVSPQNSNEPTPCVIFVHGSGDLPRDGFGYYQSYWKNFANKGWCSLSWDKPGVGNSSGNWQTQSMEDRASEVVAAIEFLRAQDGMKDVPIGLIGFSQAGWVMPKAVQLRDDIAFIISVSGAIDWMQQARYSGNIRLKTQRFTQEEIDRVNQFGDRVDLAIKSSAPYQIYLDLMSEAPAGESPIMSEAYWNFILRNWRSNVRQDLRNIDIPVLALFGDHDAYVDPAASAKAYQEELERSLAPFFEIIIFENADHSLMLTNEIKPQPQGLSAWLMLFKIWFGGEKIFPDGYFETLDKWLDNFSKTSPLMPSTLGTE